MVSKGCLFNAIDKLVIELKEMFDECDDIQNFDHFSIYGNDSGVVDLAIIFKDEKNYNLGKHEVTIKELQVCRNFKDQF
jgi:hypothetical protein